MPNVLLLNASYEPLTIVSKQRAITLLLKGRVEAASQETIPIQGVSSRFQIPAVIRLRRYINVPRRGMRWSRRAILQRDRYTCAYCGISAGQKQQGRILAPRQFTVDHILPTSRGGKNSWTNTICACQHCNQRKGSRTPHEANMKLRWEPKTPRTNYLVATGQVPKAWKIYLEVP